MEKILLLHDNTASVQGLRSTLEKSGYSVFVAGDMETALNVCVTEAPGLVVLDSGAQIDPNKAYEKMKNDSRFSLVPAVLLILRDNDAGKAAEKKADCCMEWPYDEEKLLEKVKQLLKNLIVVDEEIKEFIPGFLANRKKDVSAMRKLLEEDDFDSIKKIGHDMKGSGGLYGFERISDLGKEIQKACSEKNRNAVRGLVRDLADYLEKIEIK